MSAKKTIIDMHCDTLLESYRHPEQSFYDGPTNINLKLMQEYGSLAQCFAMYLPWKSSGEDPYDLLKWIYANYQVQMEKYKDVIRPAYTAEDIERNAADGFLSSFLTIEDGAFIEDQIDRVDEVYKMGVRMIALIWNHENSIAYPNSRDPELHAKGLKPLGIETVEKMNELGMIVDCSHLNEGGFYDVAKYSSKPFVCSHSCARALCDHQRNLTDDQLKTLGDKGGVVGVNFYGHFLNQDGTPPTAERVVEHLIYMKDKAGIDSIGFGSDFDGIEDTGELVDYSGFAKILEEMDRKFTDDEIEKISHGNVLRVIREVTGR